jgi:hypothetical protein
MAVRGTLRHRLARQEKPFPVYGPPSRVDASSDRPSLQGEGGRNVGAHVCSDEAVSTLRRLLIPSAALLWGLQFAFLNPALALLLVALFDASAREVGFRARRVQRERVRRFAG